MTNLNQMRGLKKQVIQQTELILLGKNLQLFNTVQLGLLSTHPTHMLKILQKKGFFVLEISWMKTPESGSPFSISYCFLSFQTYCIIIWAVIVAALLTQRADGYLACWNKSLALWVLVSVMSCVLLQCNESITWNSWAAFMDCSVIRSGIMIQTVCSVTM